MKMMFGELLDSHNTDKWVDLLTNENKTDKNGSISKGNDLAIRELRDVLGKSC